MTNKCDAMVDIL